MQPSLTIHWFRQDLRLSDNPSLYQASQEGRVLPVYVLEDVTNPQDEMGGASKAWLHQSLKQLNDALGGRLIIERGDPLLILLSLAQQYGANKVQWNRCYEPWRIARDTEIKSALSENGVSAESFNGSLLWEPWTVLKDDGTPYKVFTPFYRKGCLHSAAPSLPLPAPSAETIAAPTEQHTPIDDLRLMPKLPWARQMLSHWQIGETAAQQRLHSFLEDSLSDYKNGRDFPARRSVSRLSPHLHFGEISPNQVWHAAQAAPDDKNRDHFLSELGWREFSYYLLFHNPHLPTQNLQMKFDRFEWREDEAAFERWCRGQTGYPLVDAAMRQLWQTGYMHNRLRMVAASFLVKNLLIDWRKGERWFWDTLVDADQASNSASWQWVAGCGADAAPYFRVFNPVKQGEKFDKDGEFTRKFVPELERMPAKYLHAPWEAPLLVLQEAGVDLGGNYPKPIVDVKSSRERALAAFHELAS
ncbi:deoxyribodipyrimidine photo-lyase [Rhodobacteraceae bacterium RKSG542]|uniref:cryptochrome/photolyase family protein n=1 Tax=Pseudovibrio flavus TaxID=2529854 RepID=UPI0012BD09B1|nr:deoxyribodipyrimidine photo-lyase [Pseudovibrio flavus]MTI17786.1 deoxyribodipyrimidine photo-lyase [Pseudovibrio flavus]